MKTALCLSGQFRCFRSVYDSIYSHLIKPLHADVFISTWHYLLPDERNPEDGTLDELRNLFKPVSMKVEPYGIEQQLKFSDAYLIQHRFEEVHVERVMAMWHKIRDAFYLADFSEYDLYIRCRMDLRLLSGIPQNEIDAVLKLGWIGIPASRHWLDSMRNDQFAFGGRSAMTSYSDAGVRAAEVINSHSKLHPERLLYWHLQNVHVGSYPASIQYRVVRTGMHEENPCM